VRCRLRRRRFLAKAIPWLPGTLRLSTQCRKVLEGDYDRAATGHLRRSGVPYTVGNKVVESRVLHALQRFGAIPEDFGDLPDYDYFIGVAIGGVGYQVNSLFSLWPLSRRSFYILGLHCTGCVSGHDFGRAGDNRTVSGHDFSRADDNR
jgi:hypothetical protein